MKTVNKTIQYVSAVVLIASLAIGIGILATSGKLNSRFVRKVRIRNIEYWHETITVYTQDTRITPSSLAMAYQEITSNRAMPSIPRVEDGRIEFTPRPLQKDQAIEYTLLIAQNDWLILENVEKTPDSCLFGVDQEGRVFELTYLSSDR